MIPYKKNELDALVQAHGAMLHASARKMGFSNTDTDELVQSVWLAFLQDTRFEGRSATSSYLFGILRNKAREWRRSAKPAEHTPVEADIAPSAEDAWLERERSESLSGCVNQLNPTMREAVTLELAGESKITVAKTMRTTIAALYVVLHRARHHLFDCMH